MAIQMRRGQEVNFDADKMLPGEWAVSLDTRYVRMCFAPGVCVRMATYDAFEVDMAKVEAILAECQTIEEVVTRINTEVSTNAQAVAEYTSQAKKYRDEAEEFRNQAEEIVGFGKATKDDLGIIRGGDNYIDENGTLVLTRTTNERELIESQNGGIRIISMDGESQQKQYSGKNLISNAITSSAGSGVTFTSNANGTVTVSGTPDTAESLGYFYMSGSALPSWLQKGTEYIASVNKNAVSGLRIQVFEYINSTWTHICTTNTEAKFKVSEDAVGLMIRLQAQSGYTHNNAIAHPMVRLATITDNTWEPFVGGIASPNPIYPQGINSVEIKEIGSHGKNLYDEVANNVEVNHSGIKFTKNEYGNLTLSGTTTASINAVMNPFTLPAGTYYYQKGTVSNASVRIYNRTTSAFIAYSDGSFTLAEESTLDVRVQADSGSAISGTIKIQIEEGSTMTEYEPYTETRETLSAPIVLRKQGDAQDILCKQNGVFGVFRMVGEEIVDSSLVDSLQMSATGNFAYLSGLLADKAKYYATDLWINNFSCSHFEAKASIDLIEAKVDNASSINTNGSLYFRIKGYDFNAYKNFVSNNTVTVQYELKTPTFEPLPLADQIALHRLKTFKGVTYLYTNSTIIPIIEWEGGTSVVGGYALEGLNSAEANRLELEQLKTLTNELATQIVAGSEA